MNLNFYMPTKIVMGKGCVSKNADVFASFGKSCLIVTGRGGAKKSGALDELCAVLNDVNISYSVFDRIEQNPTYASCRAAAELAESVGADFIVGIGGGSALDAAKAIAALAVNSDKSSETLYSAKWDKTPLPIIAIGTTAGTGSEVTPVSVITTPQGIKQSFRHDTLYPKICFGDASYTATLPPSFTRSTALDALAHCLESYFNRTANDMSRIFAKRGIEILIDMLPKTRECENVPLSFDDRERLYAASLYGGLAISVTGTAFPHTLGYFLSEEYGISHGNACAIYLEDFILHNAEIAPEMTEELFGSLGITKEFLISLVLGNLPDIVVSLDDVKIAKLSPRYENNKSLNKTLGEVNREFAVRLLKRKFGS